MTAWKLIILVMNGRPSVYLLILLSLTSFMTLSCGSGQTDFLTDTERIWLEEHRGKLDVLFGYSAPPNAFYDDEGQYTGFLVDVLKEIEDVLDFEFSFYNFETWSELMEYSRTGDDFIIVGIAQTAERSRTLYFTDSFIKIPYIIVSREERVFQTPEDLYGYKICTVRGYAVNDYLHEFFPELNVSYVKDNLEGLHAVSTSRYDAMILNQMYASYLVEEKGIVNLKVAGESGYMNKLSVAVPVGNRQLAQIMDKAVDHISRTKKEELYRKWVNLDRNTVSVKMLRRMILAAAGAGIIILLSWIWLCMLKIEVRKQTRNLLSLNEDLRIILDSIADAVVVVNRENLITNMNPVALLLSGWTLSEAKGMLFTKVFSIEGENQELSDPLQEGDRYLNPCAKLISKSGTASLVSISRAALPEGQGGGSVFVFRDITVQKENEKKLENARKLESLGILAGGIAHDFNNLLTGFFFSVELAKQLLEPDHESAQYLDKALDSCNRTIRLTEQLLTFSRGGDPILETMSIAPFLVEAVTFSLHGSNVKFESVIDPDLRAVDADMGQLSQVLGNLAINARQAMPEGGLLTLRAYNLQEEEGSFVVIEIKDTGCGIPSAEIERIFDPYFTTKDHGNGLGLASSYSIIKKHNGSIHVESEPGEGTLFRIMLPASCNALSLSPPEEEEPCTRRKLTGLILIVDDEQMILDVLKEMLASLGYQVVTASNGQEAIEKYAENLDKGIDLVISDLTIPGEMGGEESSRRILELDPDAKIIISSGYSNDSVLANYRDYGFAGVVKKPYGLDSLEKMIDSVLSCDDKTASGI
ncbi:MAG: transporter substrate-binding domain-containing protein [Spirochaetales bacterium]|nr:transporter substrate-binding domain-containing protein [Spirochaetales bacterium]